MRWGHKPPVDHKEVCALYAKGLTTNQIGRIVKRTGCRVSQILRSLGVHQTGMTGRRHTAQSKNAMAAKRRTPGSKMMTGFGYVLVNTPEHPHATYSGYVLEHRLVMERVLGRLLDPAEVVHHIDGCKTNNSPENLAVMTNPEHGLHHAPCKVPIEIVRLVKSTKWRRGELPILARSLGVSPSTLSAIQHGKTWKHV